MQQCTVDEWSCDDTTIESCVGGARFQLYLLPSPPLPSSPSRPLYSSFFSALPPSDPSSYSTPCSLLYSASPFYPSQSLPVFLHLKLYHMYITLLPLLFCSLPSSPPFYATSHACIVRTDYRMSVVRSTAAYVHALHEHISTYVCSAVYDIVIDFEHSSFRTLTIVRSVFLSHYSTFQNIKTVVLVALFFFFAY